MCPQDSGPRFPLGKLVLTPGVATTLRQDEITAALRKHAHGDWGELDEEDWQENDFSVEADARILSAYTSQNGDKFWIITEADRSTTTVLLPSEY